MHRRVRVWLNMMRVQGNGLPSPLTSSRHLLVCALSSPIVFACEIPPNGQRRGLGTAGADRILEE